MDDSSSVKIKLNKKLDKRAPVFLVDFSNGFVNTNSTRSLDFECYRFNEDSEHRNARRILVANNGRLNYSAACDSSCASLRYFIGVRNKSTGRIRLHDAVSFHLRPQQKHIEFKPASQKSYRENAADLTAKFGSKISQRALGARSKYELDNLSIGKIVEDHPVVNDVSVMDEKSSKKLSASTSSSLDYIPPQNAEAATIYEVYNIRDIISDEELHALEEEAKHLLNPTPDELMLWERENTYSKYVLSHIEDGTVNLEKAPYLVYYDYLLAFLKLRYTDMQKRDPAPHIPQPFKQNLLRNFTLVSNSEGNRIVRKYPAKMKDKVLSYLMVLALFIDDFRVNTALMQSDLKLGMNSVFNVAQALGCHIGTHNVKNTQIKFAELKLPLKVYTRKHSKMKF